MDVGIRYGDGPWPDLKSTFPQRDAFFPVCSPALLDYAPSDRKSYDCHAKQ
jgi:LysR family transcriptional regulator, glycine cleavage system transcriptional activator